MTITKCFLVTIGVLSIVGVARAEDDKVSGKDVPAIVRKVFAESYPNAKLRNWDKEKYEGKVVYEAETEDGKINRNVMYSPEGKVVQIEETVPVPDLAPVIRESMAKEYPNAIITSAEKITHGDKIEYKLNLKNAAKKRVVVNADGSVSK